MVERRDPVTTVNSTWGLNNRLARIFDPDTQRTVMLAVDHGYFMGPTSKLEEPRRTIEPLAPYADALMLTRGVLRTSVDPRWDLPTVLRISGGNSILDEDISNERLTTTVQEAVRCNASAVAVSIYVGAEHEHQSLMNLAEAVNECEEAGIPVLAVTAVGKELEKRDARYLGLSCRIAAELGAHFVKTYYCDDFEKVVEATPVPLICAGGPKMETPKDAFQLAHDAVEAGAYGLDMGRNIWQDPAPVAKIRGIRAVVHEGYTPDEADQLYQKLVEKGELEEE